MEELELRTGVVWGGGLPSFLDIDKVVEQDERESRREAAQYSIVREEDGKNGRSLNARGRVRV
ncbi:MAG: hypothetical protein AVDCRST_MAG86-1734 [uncultured Truepera sp.]|uniref:Uncharacterized protein n=1 Tax=uncultured Truepera sp. TaxID=543023 RepID=A0A6J4V7Z1_9DEIN|nr:MAG: hypothetical protein AVDCRST_MAG86-1734 [uncultured Truepera sp.]